jgi:hypothetical protein
MNDRKPDRCTTGRHSFLTIVLGPSLGAMKPLQIPLGHVGFIFVLLERWASLCLIVLSARPTKMRSQGQKGHNAAQNMRSTPFPRVDSTYISLNVKPLRAIAPIAQPTVLTITMKFISTIACLIFSMQLVGAQEYAGKTNVRRLRATRNNLLITVMESQEAKDDQASPLARTYRDAKEDLRRTVEEDKALMARLLQESSMSMSM